MHEHCMTRNYLQRIGNSQFAKQKILISANNISDMAIGDQWHKLQLNMRIAASHRRHWLVRESERRAHDESRETNCGLSGLARGRFCNKLRRNDTRKSQRLHTELLLRGMIKRQPEPFAFVLRESTWSARANPRIHHQSVIKPRCTKVRDTIGHTLQCLSAIATWIFHSGHPSHR
jgi:hypothetical protein